MQYPGGQPGPEHSGGMDGDDGRGPGGAGGGEGSEIAVFIGNLQWWTTDVELETHCSEYGQVANMRFIEDKACGKSRGMAIVEFADPEAAARCVSSLNG
jgi:RNA recognition motif-containing protein